MPIQSFTPGSSIIVIFINIIHMVYPISKNILYICQGKTYSRFIGCGHIYHYSSIGGINTFVWSISSDNETLNSLGTSVSLYKNLIIYYNFVRVKSPWFPLFNFYSINLFCKGKMFLLEKWYKSRQDIDNILSIL